MDALGWIGVAVAAIVVIRLILVSIGSIVSSRIERRMRDTPLGRAVSRSAAQAGVWGSSPGAQRRAREAYLDLAQHCGPHLPSSRLEVERQAEEFASGRYQAPSGPLLVQAAYLLTSRMSRTDVQRALGSDRAMNDISSSMFISLFGDFARALRKSTARRDADRLTLDFAFMFYLLHERAVAEGHL